MNKVYERTTSSFGISIGTGLMLESVFNPTEDRYDPDREIPIHIDIDDYHIHYYNIYTLARNVITAIADKSIREDVFMSSTLLYTVLEDISNIVELYRDTKCKPILFIPNYSKVFKNMNIGKEGTIVNKDYEIYTYMLKMSKTKNIDIPMDIEHGTHLLKSNLKSTLITTHISSDLLNYRRIPKLKLLESHTGKLKDRSEWYTKLHKLGTKQLNIIPFIEELVYILGDKNFVLPFKLTIRRKLYELAIDRKWTSQTSSLKVLTDLRRNELFKSIVKDYTKVY